LIVVNVDGEIARKTKLEFQSQTTYGSVFLKVKSLLNEYSDLSGFDFYEPIKVNIDINIPTIDRNNHYDSNVFININSANKQQLMSLPQIGEKRSEKILEYIKNNGKIKTWEEFFKIVSMKDEYKNEIKKQAIL
jgi:DNA uptake protein ComE-like DNA-binding protein